MSDNTRKAYELLEEALTPTEDETDPWLQVDRARDLLEKEIE